MGILKKKVINFFDKIDLNIAFEVLNWWFPFHLWDQPYKSIILTIVISDEQSKQILIKGYQALIHYPINIYLNDGVIEVDDYGLSQKVQGCNIETRIKNFTCCHKRFKRSRMRFKRSRFLKKPFPTIKYLRCLIRH